MSETLYERLGAASGVDKLVDRIIDLHLENDRIATRWSQVDEATMAKSRAAAKQFFTVGTGGPGEYSGRSMPEAHAGMNIDAEEYMAVVDDIMQALQEFGHPQPVRDEVLGIAYSLKGEILHK